METPALRVIMPQAVVKRNNFAPERDKMLELTRKKSWHLRGDINVALPLIVSIAVTCFLGAAWAFSVIAPEPYMDEVFHVPQTQAYCRRNYGQWDPKITTPPGLYVFGVAYAWVVSFFSSAPASSGLWLGGQVCAASVLRTTNWGFSIGTMGVMKAILGRRMVGGGLEEIGKAFAHAILLWLYPVSFFFSFLFYTDPGATFFVLLCYLLSTGRPRGGTWWRRSGSALAGGVAVFFRQTNAIWVAFTLAVCLLEDFAPLVSRGGALSGAESCAVGSDANEKMALGSQRGIDSNSTASLARRRRKAVAKPDVGSDVAESEGGVFLGKCKGEIGAQYRGGRDNFVDGGGRVWNVGIEHPNEPEGALLPPLPTLLPRLIRAALADAYRGAPLLRCRAPLAIPVVLFAVFVWVFNDGEIVLGDKDNHSPGGPPHLAQLAYLSAVGASLWGLVGREAVVATDARHGFVRWFMNRGGIRFVSIVIAVALSLRRYSLAHPFLLSDNRHYPFYVWQRLLSSPNVRVALAPVYVFCAWLMVSRLLERKHSLWVVAYAVAAVIVLVPSPLVEPRYLTIPIILAHLESRERSWAALLAGVAACAVVNVVTIYIFLCRPFVWHDGSVARFMW